MEPITTELRELAQDMNWTEIIDHIHARNVLDGDWLDSWHKAFDARCDAIDAVHARLEQENEVLLGCDAIAFAKRIEDAAMRREDVTLFGVDYMANPFDAEGVPIHVGDEMEWMTDNETFEVIGIGGPNTLFYECNGHVDWTTASNKVHHKADTWERIEADAKKWMYENGTPNGVMELIARCKALAGDAK